MKINHGKREWTEILESFKEKEKTGCYQRQLESNEGNCLLFRVKRYAL